MKWNKPEEFTIIKLIDAEIYDVATDRDYLEGCSTCDYGSEYSVVLEFKYRKDRYDYLTFSVSSNDMYEYRFNTGGIVLFIIANLDNFKEMTLEEFKEFWTNLCKKRTFDMTDEELSVFDMIKSKDF